jgi:hypothetical protein
VMIAMSIPHRLPPVDNPLLYIRRAYAGPYRVGTSTPPHYQRLNSGLCRRDLRWLPKLRPVAQEGRP